MQGQAVRRATRALRPPQAARVACGAQVQAEDGRILIDFHNDAGAVLLGHADAEIEAAVVAEGLDTLRLRASVAEALLSLMPLAQAAYLFGSPAAARRALFDLVRNATGRDRVLVCAAGHAGPDHVAYGRLELMERELTGSSVAAILLEPVGLAPPCPAYLAGLRSLADRHGALLVFDETASAFRVHEGGAQTLFNVRPDLTLIGQSLANGRPIGALVGDPILLATVTPTSPPSGAGLAAAAATLARIADEPVTTSLAVHGAEVQAEITARIHDHRAENILSVAGDPTMSALVFAEGLEPLAGLCVRELEARGVRRSDRHYISYAHADRDIARLLDAYDQILPILVRAAAGEEGVVRLQQQRLARELAAR